MLKLNKTLMGFILSIVLFTISPLTLAEEINTSLKQQAVSAATSAIESSSLPTGAIIQQTLLQASQEEGTIAPASANDETIIYPIHSSLLTPGQVAAHAQTSLNLAQPIFLVGSDALSYQWLIKNAKQLQTLHAIGFLIEAQSEADYQRIKNLIGDTPLIPLSADAFAAAWRLDHYPVLVSSQGIEQ